MFGTPNVIQRLVFLIDFNQLINESDPDATVESLQQISFFALLALINLTEAQDQMTTNFQNLAGQFGIILTIVKQLKNGVYDPKKTACVCLSNVTRGNKENQEALVVANGVSLLAELISDEDEDEELSDRAYKCLEQLGPSAITQLMKSLQSILSQRDYNWNEKSSIIVDCIGGVERHLCTLKDLKGVPNVRDFGIQDQNDLLD